MLSPNVTYLPRTDSAYAYGAAHNTYGAGNPDSFLAEYAPKQISSELLASVGATAFSGQVETITA